MKKASTSVSKNKSAKAKPTGSYHHGNLKQTLVDACLELLRTESFEKLSLRKLATTVGVAPTAVYNHFADKEELMVTVKTGCLLHLADYLEKHSSKRQSPEKRINALGKAYFEYSIEHTHYFSCLFDSLVPDEYVTQDLTDAAMRAEAELRAAVIDLLKKHDVPITQYNEGLGAFACWSIAHGVTTLAAKHINHAACLTGRWPVEFMLHNEESVRKAFDAMTDVLIAGILSAAKK